MEKQLWDLCEMCQHYGKECPGHKNDGTAYTCYAYKKAKEALTPDEVLDIIVEWNGGIASGYHVRSIISRVYGVEL